MEVIDCKQVKHTKKSKFVVHEFNADILKKFLLFQSFYFFVLFLFKMIISTTQIYMYVQVPE